MGLLPANIAGLSSVMVPVVAMVSGALINGEPLGPLQLLSMASCVAALVLALGKHVPSHSKSKIALCPRRAAAPQPTP